MLTSITLNGVSYAFGANTVLNQIDLHIEPGSVVALLGPSGSGKTTLLRILAGFETPDTGRIVMQGRTLFDENRFVPAHQRGIGFVPQEGALFPHLNVADNIAWGLDGTRHEKRQRVEALMEMVLLDRQLATHWPHEISGGQQQRVALARAIVAEPRVLLFDEPLSNLDSELRESLCLEMSRLLRQLGITAVYVTHDRREAELLADKIVHLSAGCIAAVRAVTSTSGESV